MASRASHPSGLPGECFGWAAQGAGAARVRQDHAALAFAALTVLKPLEYTADVLVELAITVFRQCL